MSNYKIVTQTYVVPPHEIAMELAAAADIFGAGARLMPYMRSTSIRVVRGSDSVDCLLEMSAEVDVDDPAGARYFEQQNSKAAAA
jgi:hypothetical protein